MRSARPSGSAKSVNLALQGGGAHGAFTWGVLDYLLERGDIGIDGVSGTSAGGMNAVVALSGLLTDGPDGAREALSTFWKAIADAARLSSLKRSPIQALLGHWDSDSAPGYLLWDMISRIASPYDLNPLDINPLRDVVERSVDWDAVRACTDINLYIAATNVETGKVRIFENAEMSPDVLLASACLPLLFKAVEIDGVPYWDGGYSANPALFPFAAGNGSRDIIIVQINPVERPGTPKSARAILNRMNEITFNAGLLKELRAIDFVARLVDGGALSAEAYRKFHVHAISSDALDEMSGASRLNADWKTMERLRDIGRDAAASFVDRHWHDLGKRSSLDIMSMVA